MKPYCRQEMPTLGHWVSEPFLSHPTPSLRPNSFVIITANRVLHCNAETPEEMHHWITLLQRSKGDTRVEGQEFIVRGDCQPRVLVFLRQGL